MDGEGKESTPITITLAELDRLRVLFREAMDHYAARVDSEILEVREKLSTLSTQKKLSSSKMRDLRDMLTILRHVQIKSDKGRRKDIKKVDALVADLQMLVESW